MHVIAPLVTLVDEIILTSLFWSNCKHHHSPNKGCSGVIFQVRCPEFFSEPSLQNCSNIGLRGVRSCTEFQNPFKWNKFFICKCWFSSEKVHVVFHPPCDEYKQTAFASLIHQSLYNAPSHRQCTNLFITEGLQWGSSLAWKSGNLGVDPSSWAVRTSASPSGVYPDECAYECNT